MATELIYTSSERGLRPGTRGFCTVAYTKGLRAQHIQLLESLSAYNNLYGIHDPRARLNPVAYSHYRTLLFGRNLSILSRVGPAQADHTQRNNKLAHHILLTATERTEAGPGWLCAAPGFFMDSWMGEPRVLETPKEIPAGHLDSLPSVSAWETLTGDRGWAGCLAHWFLARPATPTYIVFEPGMDVLPLVVEAQAFLPPTQRWQVTFNTFFTALPARMSCNWRFCVADAPCLKEARRQLRAQLIDLTKPLSAPPDNDLVQLARRGSLPCHDATQPEKQQKDTGFIPLPNRNKRKLRMKPGKREDDDRDDA